jgi:hypothetical protein
LGIRPRPPTFAFVNNDGKKSHFSLTTKQLEKQLRGTGLKQRLEVACRSLKSRKQTSFELREAPHVAKLTRRNASDPAKRSDEMGEVLEADVECDRRNREVAVGQ